MADNIRQFDAGLTVPQPTEIGIEATAQAARRLGAFYNQSAQATERTGQRAGSAIKDAGDAAVDFAAHQEIVHGALGLAGMHAKLTDDWNKTASGADPNDPTVAKKWQEQSLNPAIEQFQGAFLTEKGQKWAESRVDALREHLYTKTSADMSTLAGMAVHQNIRQLTNAYSTTAQNDPTSVFESLSHIDASFGGIVDSAPNLTADQKGKFKLELAQTAKEQVVKAAVYGAIQRNPEEGLKLAQDSRLAPYVNGMEVKQFETYARGEQRLQRTQRLQEQAEYRRQQTDGANAAATKSFVDFTSIGPDGQLKLDPKYFSAIRDVATKYGEFAHTLPHSMLALGENIQHNAEKGIKDVDDPMALKKLQSGILDGSTTLEDLMKAKVDRQLSDASFAHTVGMFERMRKEPLEGPVIKETLKGVESHLVLPIASAKFMQSFIPQYMALSPQDRVKAIDFDDPNSLISKLMKQYDPPDQQKMTYRLLKNLGISGMPGAPAPAPVNAGPVVVGGQEVPLPLRQLDGLQWSASRGQWRDSTGKVYDKNGYPVK